MLTYPSVRQCFALTALLSAFFPKSATFSLLTLRRKKQKSKKEKKNKKSKVASKVCCVLRTDCPATRHDHADRTQVAKTSPRIARCTTHRLRSCSTHPSMKQCFSTSALLIGLVPRSATFSAHSQPLGSDLILHPQVRHIYLLQIFPIPCLWRMCSAAVASMASTGFTAKRESNIMLWTPFASDAPNAAAYSSASALLFAMTFCLRVYAFRVCLHSISMPALRNFRVSLQPAQSESVNTVSSSASTPYPNTCLYCLSRF